MALALPKSLLKGLVSQIDVGTRGASPHAPYDHVQKVYSIPTAGTQTIEYTQAYPGLMRGINAPASGNYSTLNFKNVPAWDIENVGVTMASGGETDDSDNNPQFSLIEDGELSTIQMPWGYFETGRVRPTWWDGVGVAQDFQINAGVGGRLVSAGLFNSVVSIKDGEQYGRWQQLGWWANAGDPAYGSATNTLDGVYNTWDAVRLGGGEGTIYWLAFWNRMLTDNEQIALAEFVGNPFLELHKQHTQRPALYLVPGTLPEVELSLAPVVEKATFTALNDSGTLVVDLGNPQEGELLIMFVASSAANPSGSLSIDDNSWTEADQTNSNFTQNAALYYKIAGASETSPTVTSTSSSPNRFIASVVRVSDHGGFDVSAQTVPTQDTSGSLDALSISPNDPDSLVLTASIQTGFDPADFSHTIPTGTELVSQFLDFQYGAGVAKYTYDAGPTGTRTWTSLSPSSGNGKTMFQVAIRPLSASDIKIDTFTESQYTHLDNHISDSGHTWAAGSDYAIEAGTGVVRPLLSGDKYARFTRTPINPNYWAEVRGAVAGSTDVFRIGAIIRGDNGSTGYAARIHGNGFLYLYEATSGVFTQLGSAYTIPNFSVTQEYTVRVTADGSTISADLDGVEQISVTDTTHTTALSPGMLIRTTNNAYITYFAFGQLAETLSTVFPYARFTKRRFNYFLTQ